MSASSRCSWYAFGVKTNNCPECQHAKEILQQWLDKQSHDRCWYYPDLFLKLAQLVGVKASKPPTLPSRREFEAGCKRYQDEQFS